MVLLEVPLYTRIRIKSLCLSICYSTWQYRLTLKRSCKSEQEKKKGGRNFISIVICYLGNRKAVHVIFEIDRSNSLIFIKKKKRVNVTCFFFHFLFHSTWSERKDIILYINHCYYHHFTILFIKKGKRGSPLFTFFLLSLCSLLSIPLEWYEENKKETSRN